MEKMKWNLNTILKDFNKLESPLPHNSMASKKAQATLVNNTHSSNDSMRKK